MNAELLEIRGASNVVPMEWDTILEEFDTIASVQQTAKQSLYSKPDDLK